MVFETLKVSREGAVLFVDIAAPPMNLLGPELVRDLVSLIKQTEADSAVKVLVFKSGDPDYFSPRRRDPDQRVPAGGGEADRRSVDRPSFSPFEREPARQHRAD